jgi:hypothetical protein
MANNFIRITCIALRATRTISGRIRTSDGDRHPLRLQLQRQSKHIFKLDARLENELVVIPEEEISVDARDPETLPFQEQGETANVYLPHDKEFTCASSLTWKSKDGVHSRAKATLGKNSTRPFFATTR